MKKFSMKTFLGLILATLFASCSTTYYTPKPVVQEEQEAPDFMDLPAIIAEMNAPQDKSLTQEMSEEERLRYAHLIDEKVFFDKEEIKKLEATKEEMLFKSAPQTSGKVDLRYRDTPIKSQDNGKCTAYAGLAALENTLNGIKKESRDLSEWHIWSKYRQYSCSAFMKAITSNRVADEKYYPQYKSCNGCEENAHAMVTKSTYIGNDVDRMTAALDQGKVVYLGMSTPRDMLRCKRTISPDTEKTGGGHALLVSGYYRDPSVPGNVIAILKNSWGSNCGDYGYQYVPLGHLCKRSDMYCIMWTIDAVDSKKKTTPDTPTAPTAKKRYCYRVWYYAWLVKKCYWK